MSFSLLLFLQLTVLAPDSAPADTAQPAARAWVVPTRLLLHTAGGQGLAAAGAGWTGHDERLAVDALVGYLPKQYSITPIGIFTLKASYGPWLLPVGNSAWQVQPLAMGGFISYSASRGLNATRDDKYEDNYYWWSAHTRLGAFVGGSAGRHFRPGKGGRPRSAMAYYELGTNDLYLVSWITKPGALPLSSILTLGFGLRLQVW